ncbi:threonine synthase [Candidatus Chlorohelix sp.]|uniref:threonine synthase n=1 Tax=Candidatus Chlorohelix sp. TaxID=3139201 RepID=UPI00303FA104
MLETKVVCIQCGREYELSAAISGCETCDGLLEVKHNLEALKGVITREWAEKRRVERGFPNGSGVWRWRELVAPFPNEAIVSRNEGNTNLYEDARLAKWAGLENLWLKHEGENPTGSFKDRGMTVGISHANWIGAKYVACASSGNTSASLAGYAARAGLKALTFIPSGKVALGKLSQTMAYGAKTVQVEGSFDDALELVRRVSKEKGMYLVNSLNPFRLEGQKTIIFEALQQLDWQAPDWIVVSGGNLGNTSAFGKALWEMRELGLIGEKLPRIATIQAEGASPFYQYYRSEFTRFKPQKPETVATAIRIGNPVNLAKARRAIEWTDGVVDLVTDIEIMEAKAVLDRSGIGGEPAAGATLAGVRKLREKEIIGKGDLVVAIMTGHILKDADSIVNYHSNPANPGANPLVQMAGTLDDLMKLLEDN